MEIGKNRGYLSSWREASSAYYGGPGLVLALLPRVPIPWAQARPWLQVVPNPNANSLTLAQYAAEVATLAAQLQSHNSPRPENGYPFGRP